jgi:hypothetical protein
MTGNRTGFAVGPSAVHVGDVVVRPFPEAGGFGTK